MAEAGLESHGTCPEQMTGCLFQRPQDTHEGQGQTRPPPLSPTETKEDTGDLTGGRRCLARGGHHAMGPASQVLAGVGGSGNARSAPSCIPHRPPHHPLRSSGFAEDKAS